MENRYMDRFLTLYQKLDAGNLETLQDVYREDIRFVDPAHEIKGLEELTIYFHHLYQGVDHIEFDFSPPLVTEGRGSVRWEMKFSHRRLARGKTLAVEGVSYIEYDEQGKVFFHRDYFDLGQMLYEHVPLLGRLVLYIKKRLGK